MYHGCDIMDLEKLFITIITSSVVSVIISSLFSEHQKRNDYKRDYYKKIIDKRLNAYEKLQNYIGYMNIVITVKEPDENIGIGDGSFVYLCFSKKEYLVTAARKTEKIIDDAVWFSDEITKSLYALNHIFSDVEEAIRYPNKKNLEHYNLDSSIKNHEDFHIAIGIKVFDKMNTHIKTIKKGLLEDIKTIDNVKDFLNGKR